MQFDIIDNIIYSAEWNTCNKYTKDGNTYKEENIHNIGGNKLYCKTLKLSTGNHVFYGTSFGTHRLDLADGKTHHIDKHLCKALFPLKDSMGILGSDNVIRRWKGTE